MHFLKIAALLSCVCLTTHLKAQTVACPPNIDFENGNLNNWQFFTGSCCPINTPVQSGALANRHVLTSGTATDQYGGFPIVAPGGGNYSLKLGNNSTGAQAEKARYYIHVPANLNNYSLVYRYAVVFQNPNHPAAEQPRFDVRAYDSATNAPLNCNQFSYVASSSLPGFTLSTAGPQVYYKNWTTASLNLSGMGGKTIIVDFASADCSQGAHFGYGYVDMTCGLFAISTTPCAYASTLPLSGPFGFQTYEWWDASFTNNFANGQNITIPTPTVTTTYKLVVTPYAGYGCTDTLTTTILGSVATPLAATITPTNVACNGSNNGSATANITGGIPPYTYSWNTTPVQTTATISNLAPGSYTVTATDTAGCTITASVNITQPTTLNASISGSANVSCNGGSNGTATVTATGGTAPYTYSWNTTPVQTSAAATNLPAGTYIATVTDNKGCIKTATVTITEPTVLNASITATTGISCYGGNNGSATVGVTGGTPPYTYSWNTTPVKTTATATNLTAGTYTVTVTDNKGCTDTAMVTISQPIALSASITGVSNILCNPGSTGSATVTPAGGTPPYTYSWNTTPVQTTATITALPAGTYTATVTDSKGCITTASVTITQPASALAATITSFANVSCNNGNNGSATVTPTGGTAPYTYSWNTTPAQTTATATGLAPGTYTVTVTDNNGCIKTASVTITQPSTLNANITASANVLCNSGNNGSATVTATGGTPGYTYAWNTTPVQTTATATNLTAGTYTVTVTDNNGCTKTAMVTITQPITVNASIQNITHVSCNGGNNGSATAGATGGTPGYTYSWNTTPVQTTATATNLSAGTYTVTVTDNSGCTGTATVTITQPNILSAAISGASNVLCNPGSTGSATVTPTGGTPPYSYSWNTIPVQTTATITTLPAGTYTATVTDNKGCITTASVTITQPAAPLTATISNSTNVSCNNGNNGSATVTPAGGTAPYTYVWNTTPVQATATATGLAAGTYNVTVTDLNNCTYTTSVTITEPPALATSISNVIHVSCVPGNNGSATINASGGTLPYTYVWNTTPTQNTATATGLSAGTYTATVTDGNGCTDSKTVIITQPSALNATINKTDVSCNGINNGSAAAVVTGGSAPYTYSWNTTPVQTTQAINNLAPGTYTVTVTDNNNCSITASVTITQPAILAAAISSSANVTCYGGSNGNATATVTGGTAPYNYLWNTTPAQTSATATGLTAGSYTVTVTDNNGCTQTATVTINQPTLLNANITASANVTCNGGNNGGATITASGGTAPYTYSWNTTPAQTTANATNLTAGTYIVTVTDNSGCIKTTSVTITQPAPVNATISAANNVNCNGGSNGSATVTVLGGTAPYTYLWNTSPAQTTATATGLAAGTYTVTTTDNMGCSNTATVTITQPAILNVTVNKTDIPCFGTNNGIATAVPAGGTSPYTYSWNTTPVQTTGSISNLPAGTYTVTVTDNKGCTQTGSTTIGQPGSLLTASITNITDVNCNGGNDGSASVSANGGTTPYTYTWSTTPVQTTALASGLTAGSYNVVVKDANNCIVTQTVTISQPPVLDVTADVAAHTCPGLNQGIAYLTVLGGTQPYNYSWNTTPTQSTDTIKNLFAGAYQVTVTDGKGCTDAANIVVNEYETNISAGEDMAICLGQSVTLQASGGTNYSWSPTANLSCINCTSPVVAPKQTTTYTLTGIDGLHACPDTDQVTITIIEKKPVSAGPDQETCENGAVQLNADGGIAYVWSPAGTLDNSSIANPVAQPTESTTYQVIITQNECFKDTLYQHVKIHPKPTVYLGPDQKIMSGAQIQLKAETTNAHTINWTPLTGLSCGDCFDPFASIAKTITYVATVTSAEGCVASDDITLIAGCDGTGVFIPNTFTPNGDGENDKFYPMGKGLTRVDRFIIYNRWGEPVFEASNMPANDPAHGWDGTFKGMPVKPDVFVYMVQIPCAAGSPVFIKGDISLIR